MRWKVFIGAFLLSMLAACSDEAVLHSERAAVLETRSMALESELRALNSQQAVDETGLLVQLAFGAEADLDLYVTDPLLETVYFANKAGKSGGEISDDYRCDSASLKVEQVRFKMPLSGSYRVGVDYPNRCGSKEEEFGERAAWSLSVMHNGKRQYIVGTVGYRFFEVAAFDFNVDNNEGREHAPSVQ